MKKIKNIVLFLLVGTLLLSVLAGCAGKSGQGEGAKEDTSNYLPLTTGLEGDEYFYIDRDYAIDSTQVDPTQAEYDKAEKYLKEKILESADGNSLGFDFAVDGVFFSSVFSEYTRDVQTVAESDIKTDYEVTYTKDGQPLRVRIVAAVYKVSPVCEWTVWIENTGNEKSGVITEFSGLKDSFGKADDDEYKVLTFDGSRDSTASFNPHLKSLGSDKAITVKGSKGRSTVRWAPYFNVEWNNSKASWGREGVFVSVGWTGQWVADIEKKDGNAAVNAKQEYLETYLNPGESIRSARIDLLFWEKDLIRCQNIWRSFLYNYLLPQEDNQPIKPLVQMNNNLYVTNLMENATTANQISGINIRALSGLNFDQWQMDAGWSKLFGGSWWNSVGTWTPDVDRFGEDGMKKISDAAHAKDVKTVLWFEPERVCPYTDFNELSEDWLIYGIGQKCFDLSNDDALQYLCEFISGQLKAGDIDVYRQDCNFDLLDYWLYKDKAQDGKRIGYTENKYLVNFYRYYDYLIENAGIDYIDNCASGGKRMDLEIQCRSLSLWRDDKCNDPIVTQCQTYGVNLFNPYTGQSTVEANMTLMKYVNRSNFMQATNFVYNVEGQDPNLIKALRDSINEYKTYSPYFVCDYYPLTPLSDNARYWIGWQFDDRDTNSGIMQIFKRAGGEASENTYYLSGLEKDTVYVVTDVDTDEVTEKTGAQLMTEGFTVTIKGLQDAKLFHYQPK